jgi:hypothetical protein
MSLLTLKRSILVAMLSFILASAIGAADNTPPAGFTALFNGNDLTGWKGLVDDPPKRARLTQEQLVHAQAKADEKMRAHWSVDGFICEAARRCRFGIPTPSQRPESAPAAYTTTSAARTIRSSKPTIRLAIGTHLESG